MSLFPWSARRAAAVARKEVLHFARDPRMRPIVFVAPIIQLVILGIAANMDVEHLKLVVVDQDHSQVSREITARFDAGSGFDLLGVTASPEEAERAIDRGTAEIVVLIPPGTARALERNEPATLPIWLDGSDTNRAVQSSAFAESVLRRVALERTKASPAVRTPPLPDARIRLLYNPTLRTRWFMIPAVVAMVLTIITILLSAMAIVKERENGTIEQLVVTPIRPVELILGKLLPFVAISSIVTVLVTLAGVFLFRVPFRGNPLELAAFSLLYLLSTLAMGLLASTMSNTQQQAMMSVIAFVLPSFLLGGVFYPIGNMPGWAQAIADVIPVRYFVVMLRGAFLKGIGFETLGVEAFFLGAIGVVLLVVAIFRFRKRSA